MSILPSHPNDFYSIRWRKVQVYDRTYYVFVETNLVTHEENIRYMLTEKEYFKLKLQGQITDEK